MHGQSYDTCNAEDNCADDHPNGQRLNVLLALGNEIRLRQKVRLDRSVVVVDVEDGYVDANERDEVWEWEGLVWRRLHGLARVCVVRHQHHDCGLLVHVVHETSLWLRRHVICRVTGGPNPGDTLDLNNESPLGLVSRIAAIATLVRMLEEGKRVCETQVCAAGPRAKVLLDLNLGGRDWVGPRVLVLFEH